MTEGARYRGSCHCGAVAVDFATDKSVDELWLRACGCSFCRRHGARATSDPAGRIRITAASEADLQRYRFGLATADFLLCRTCGCYLGALLSADDGAWFTINVNCLDERAAFPAAAEPISFDDEDEAGRIARRRANWTPAELVIGAEA